jgi:hypothetical protein
MTPKQIASLVEELVGPQVTTAPVATRPIPFTPSPTDPLRLADVARLAFPMGGVTERTLRREHKRGRLKIYEIGGKHFTTLRDVADMTRACSVTPPWDGSRNAVSMPDTTTALTAALDALDKL